MKLKPEKRMLKLVNFWFIICEILLANSESNNYNNAKHIFYKLFFVESVAGPYWSIL